MKFLGGIINWPKPKRRKRKRIWKRTFTPVRRNQAKLLNGAMILIGQLCDVIDQTLEIHAPGSEPAREEIIKVRNMAIGLIDHAAGFPLATPIEQASQPTEQVT